MGVNSPFFTRRFAAPCKTLIEQLNPNVMHEAGLPITAPEKSARIENGGEGALR
jgi:hypothetical protein